MIIPTIKRSGLLCYNACLIAALDTLHLPYWFTYAQLFDIRYYEGKIENKAFIGNPTNNGRYTIGSRISTGENHSGKNCLVSMAEKYFGLTVQNIENFSIPNIQRLIREEQLVLLNTNIFWCPWLDGYQNGQIDHKILVHKILEDDSLECVDPMQMSDYCTLPLSDYQNGVTSASILSFSPKELDPAAILKDSVLCIEIDRMKADMESFIEDLQHTTHFEDEFNNCDQGFWYCDLYRNLCYYVSSFRSLYAFYLLKTGQYLNDTQLIHLSKSFDDLSVKWSRLKGLFIRGFQLRNFSDCKDSLNNKLCVIKEAEFKAGCQLINYVISQY